jgi:hypothetical protein
MRITRNDLDWAAGRGIISADQSRTLWQALEERGSQAAFDFANVAYYFGAMIAIGAMGWFMNRAWEQLGGGALLAVALVYGALFLLAGWHLWNRENLRVPGGLLATMAVCMTPLGVYGLENWMGWWPGDDPYKFRSFYAWAHWRQCWIGMELATIGVGLAVLSRIRFSFLAVPVTLSLWLMSMDAAPLLLGRDQLDLDEQKVVSLVFGMALLAAAYFLDRRTRADYAFWGYLFGLLAFWGSITFTRSDNEWAKFIYCLMNVGLVLLAVFLERPVFAAFGAIGVNIYLAEISYRLFKDSLLFPLALVFLGVLIIYGGVSYQKHRRRIEESLLGWLPGALRQMRPANRAL